MGGGQGKGVDDGQVFAMIILGLLAIGVVMGHKTDRLHWGWYERMTSRMVGGCDRVTRVTSDLSWARQRMEETKLGFVERPMAGWVAGALEKRSIRDKLQARFFLRLYRGAVPLVLCLAILLVWRRQASESVGKTGIVSRIMGRTEGEGAHRPRMVTDLAEVEYGTDFRMEGVAESGGVVRANDPLLSGITVPEFRAVAADLAAFIRRRGKEHYRAGHGLEVGAFADVVERIYELAHEQLVKRYGVLSLPRERQRVLVAVLAQDLGKLKAFFLWNGRPTFAGRDHEVKSLNILLNFERFRLLPEKDRTVIAALVLSHHTRALPESIWRVHAEDQRFMRQSEAIVVKLGVELAA